MSQAVLVSLTMSLTKEIAPRLEIWGRPALGKRVYVVTLTTQSHDDLEAAGRYLYTEVKGGPGMTREQIRSLALTIRKA